MNQQFQQQLKQLTFKTFHHNQIATFDYDDLFSNQRIVIFSITNAYTVCSQSYMDQFDQAYPELTQHGIDNIYAVDSTDWLIGPWADKRSDSIKGLPDRDMQFVKLLGDYYNQDKELIDLARYWQYIIIINDGVPEKLWHNPFKPSAPLLVLKSLEFRYRKLSPDIVKQYLLDNPR